MSFVVEGEIQGRDTLYNEKKVRARTKKLEGVIGELNSVIAFQKAKIAELEDAANKKDKEIADLKYEMKAIRDKNTILRKQLKELGAREE